MIQLRRLVLVGSVLVDILMYVERLPERGGDTIAQRTLFTSGGGFNLLLGATRLGLPVCYAGRVGDGPMGLQVMRDLTMADIPLVLPQVCGEDTGFDIGLVEADADRTFVTSPGTEARLTPADLDCIPLQAGDAIYVSGYDLGYPISGAALEQWLPVLAPNMLLVIDPGPLVAAIPAERLARVLARTNIISVNERELFLLTNATTIPDAARLLRAQLMPSGYVIVRAGAQGCWLAGKDLEPCLIPGRVTQAIDTTGAGDTHVAAFLVRLAAGDDIRRAAYVANVAASLSTECIGPATSPTAQVLQDVLASDKTIS